MKTILITGANRGIGLEICQQYANAGHQVIATCRLPEQATALQSLAQEKDVTIYPLDVSSDQQLLALKHKLAGKPIDIIVSNAGTYGPKQIQLGRLDRSEWLKVLDINTISPILLAQTLVDNLKAGGDKKLAIISSKMGSISDNGSGGSYLYRSSKCGVNAAAKSLAIDLAEHNISQITLHPGWVQTDMGGPNALITTQQSVQGMLTQIDNLNLDNTGRFVAYDGKTIDW